MCGGAAPIDERVVSRGSSAESRCTAAGAGRAGVARSHLAHHTVRIPIIFSTSAPPFGFYAAPLIKYLNGADHRTKGL